MSDPGFDWARFVLAMAVIALLTAVACILAERWRVAGWVWLCALPLTAAAAAWWVVLG